MKDKMIIQPPKLTSKLLEWALPNELKEPVLGDLSEEFMFRVGKAPIATKIWYQKQAVRSALQFMWKTKRGMMMFLISVLVFVGLSYGAMLLGGGVGMFIDVPSLLLVLPPAILFTLGATSLSAFKNAFGLLFNDETDVTVKQFESAKLVFNVLGNSAMYAGFFTTLIGAVAIGSNLDDMSSFGPAFAVCILTLLYGLGIKTVTYVAGQKLQFNWNEQV